MSTNATQTRVLPAPIQLTQTNPPVGVIPLHTDPATLNRRQHGTSRLMNVGAVAEVAAGDKIPHLREVRIKLFRLDVPQTEGLEARCISYVSASPDGDQLREDRSVHSFPGGLSDFHGPEFQLRVDGVQQACLSDPRRAGENR